PQRVNLRRCCMTTIYDPLAALCARLAEFELPAIPSVHAGDALSASQVCLQLTYHEPSAITQGLLAWADTLTQVTAQAWRIPPDDSVHLSVTELLPGSVSVQVDSGLWGTHRGLDSDLSPGATTIIPLPMLRHAATVEESRA
ncbi:MAG: hypothetical protein LC808_43110, partial [Actinobacteria bacterium]|nr:hypothetical protein [Actinomycetota bacterium]